MVHLLARSRGTSLVYLIVMMTALTAFASLGVDLGRVQLAKTELERAADSAARYAATGASDGTATAKAIAAAADNKVDGTPLVLQSGDIQLITYSNGTYSVGGSSPNGVMITAKRVASRGTSIPLVFLKSIGGITTCDMSATSIAVYNSGLPPYGFVGISAVMLQNNTITVNSYDSGSGSYGGANILTHGYVATNGSMTMTGGVTVSKDIYMLAGQSLTANGSPSYGTRQALTSALVFPSVSSSPGGAANLGNVNAGTTLGSGSTNTDYFANGVSLNAGQTLNINGPVTLYINGNCTLNGTVNVVNNLPQNFAIRMMSSAGVNIQTTTLYADIYAPQSPINLNSTANFYGRIIGSQLSVSGSSALHYDENLPALPGTPQAPPSSGSGAGNSISLIK